MPTTYVISDNDWCKVTKNTNSLRCRGNVAAATPRNSLDSEFQRPHRSEFRGAYTIDSIKDNSKLVVCSVNHSDYRTDYDPPTQYGT